MEKHEVCTLNPIKKFKSKDKIGVLYVYCDKLKRSWTGTGCIVDMSEDGKIGYVLTVAHNIASKIGHEFHFCSRALFFLHYPNGEQKFHVT